MALPVIFRDFLEFRWFILFVTAVVLIFTANMAFHWPDQFTASIKLRLDAVAQKSFLGKIRDQKALERTVKDLSMDRYFGTTLQGAVRILNTRVLRIKHLPQTDIFVVSATVRSQSRRLWPPEPQMAARIVKRICQEYVLSAFIDNLKISYELSELSAGASAKAERKAFLKRQNGLRSFYEKAAVKGIPHLNGFMQYPALSDLWDKIVLLQLQKKYSVGHCPEMKMIASRIESLKAKILRNEHVLGPAQASILAAFDAIKVEILETVPENNILIGPDRILYIVMSGLLSLLVACLLVSLRRFLKI